MKIVIIMTYKDRQFQLNKTLDSLCLSNYNDFEVIIVDDNSKNDIILDDYPFSITVFKMDKNNYTCPIPTYNKGIEIALEKNPDALIIQNAECIHIGDVIKYCADNITDENYFSFACFSLDQMNTFDKKVDIIKVIFRNNKSVNGNGENGWYNHSLHRAVCYDFCACISVKNIKKLNGYDERYAEGIAYADDDFLNRVHKINLETQIIDYPFVCHQWHYNKNMYTSDELLFKNRDLFCQIRETNEFKAKHIVTKDYE